jgi:mevalonate pyrophosphate decarboxylase
MEKWKEGINLEASNKDDILDYLNTRLFQYKVEKSTNRDLWELYKEDFANFDINTFSLLEQRDLRRLRAILRCGGVYIEYNRKSLAII